MAGDSARRRITVVYPRHYSYSFFYIRTRNDKEGDHRCHFVGIPSPPYETIHQAIKGLPEFLSAMGEFYVNPKDLLNGPYLGCSRDGKQELLVAK